MIELKIRKDNIFYLVLGMVLSGIICVSASSLLASNISYSNSNTSAKNVEEALNELYAKNNCDVSTTILSYDYTGYSQVYSPGCSGYFKLETWGAQGGTYNSTYYGGYGSYSTGIFYLVKDKKYFINVGGSTTTTSGGYNGGGGAINSDSRGSAFGGGGATSIATVDSLLKNLSSNQDSILIVAGGGGGAANFSGEYTYAGSAGGYLGVSASGMYPRCGTGGSQSAAGMANGTSVSAGGFGYGGTGTGSYSSAGGGGGYYGGGGGNTYPGAGSAAGGGGSGYIGDLESSSVFTKHMTCYNCATSTDASTMTNTTTNVSSTATSDYAKSGNGYARITYLGTTLN